MPSEPLEVAVANTPSEAFARWLHHRYGPVTLPSVVEYHFHRVIPCFKRDPLQIICASRAFLGSVSCFSILPSIYAAERQK